jgi:flagellar P-ring protein precursor FlgI
MLAVRSNSFLGRRRSLRLPCPPARGRALRLPRFASRAITGALLALLTTGLGTASASLTRVKDIASVKGVRSNPLIGYGLVVGLNKTGDRRQTLFSNQSLAALLNRMGVSVPPDGIKVENVAAVMVTGELPAFAEPGTTIDVTVASIGDAKSLQGGVLLMTPLKGPDNQVYAIAQGALSIGGFGASGGGGNQVQVNHLTVARVPSGARVERRAPNVVFDGSLEIVLDYSDFTTANRLATAVNRAMGDGTAAAVNARTVAVAIPVSFTDRVVEFIATVEALSVETDVGARVVINERTGTIVMGENVRISSVAVAHGSLSVRIDRQFEVSQPGPFSSRAGETVVVPDERVDVSEDVARVMQLNEGTTIAELIRALNAIGATPRDIIAILQALRAAGALQAELEII